MTPMTLQILRFDSPRPPKTLKTHSPDSPKSQFDLQISQFDSPRPPRPSNLTLLTLKLEVLTLPDSQISQFDTQTKSN